MLDRLCGANRSLGEHIGLALEVALIVQIFQRAKQKIARILTESRCRTAAVDAPVFLAVRIVLGVQPHLQILNILVRVVFQLCVNEFAAGVPQGNQRTDACQRRGTGLHHPHFGIFAVVNNIVPDGIAEIADIRVSVQGAAFFLRVVLRFFQAVLGLQVGKGSVQLGFQ